MEKIESLGRVNDKYPILLTDPPHAAHDEVWLLPPGSSMDIGSYTDYRGHERASNYHPDMPGEIFWARRRINLRKIPPGSRRMRLSYFGEWPKNAYTHPWVNYVLGMRRDDIP